MARITYIFVSIGVSFAVSIAMRLPPEGVNNVYSTGSTNPPTTTALAKTSTTSQLTTITTESSSITQAQLKVLYNNIFTGYDTRIRPVNNQTQTVRVVTRFVPTSITYFNTQSKRFEIMGYFIVMWKDEHIVWNKDAYSGTENVLLPIDDIWTPNVVIAKAHDGKNSVGIDTDQVLVTNKGLAKWVPADIYRVVCDVNVKFYPFDIQECFITYYISDETVDSVRLLYNDHADALDEYLPNSEWELVKYSVVERTNNNNNDQIHLKFEMKRRGQFAVFTLVTPLLMLSLLNGMVFLVPISTGEKANFAITIFLSYGVFISIIIKTLPHNSLNVPYFLYYMLSLVMSSVVLVFYTIIQWKIFSDIGNKPYNIRNPFMRPFKVDSNIKNKSECKPKPIITWAMFLVKMDICLFCVFFFVIASCSALFLSVVGNRLNVFG